MNKVTVERSIASFSNAKVFLNNIGYYECICNEERVKKIILAAYKKEKGIKDGEEPRNYDLLDYCAGKLLFAEEELAKLGSKTTSSDDNARNKDCRLNSDRDRLRDEIINECMALRREDDEAKIKLGVGGIRPHSSNEEASFEGKAVICIGGPASGKSSFCQSIADKLNALTLDPDIFSRKLPEYGSSCVGASMVHIEAKEMVKKLTEDVGGSKVNVVLPIIGKKYGELRGLLQSLAFDKEGKASYRVSVVLIRLDRCKAACRAFTRYIETGRYVPIPYVLDTCGHESAVSFYRLAAEDHSGSFLCINNDGIEPTIEFEQNCDDIKNILINAKKVSS